GRRMMTNIVSDSTPMPPETRKQATPGRIAIAIWLIAGVIAAWVCILTLTAEHFGGGDLPVGNDSFYHARRLLDTVRDPAGFYQVDEKIHAPEGRLLVWPWGYDYLLANIARLAMAAGISTDPLAILVWIPVAAVWLSLGLTIVIARQLSLSSSLLAFAA